MPFFLLSAGLIMIVTGVNGTHAAFGEQLRKDFTGPGNFTYWLVALGAVGAVGQIPGFKPFSHAFLALIVIAMVLRQGTGLWSRLTEALNAGPLSPTGGTTGRQGAGIGPGNTDLSKISADTRAADIQQAKIAQTNFVNIAKFASGVPV